MIEYDNLNATINLCGKIALHHAQQGNTVRYRYYFRMAIDRARLGENLGWMSPEIDSYGIRQETKRLRNLLKKLKSNSAKDDKDENTGNGRQTSGTQSDHQEVI